MRQSEEHAHDQSVSSLSIVLPGELDLDDTRRWMQDLLKEKGGDIFRMKGVLAIASSEEKFVYQVSVGPFLNSSIRTTTAITR